MFDGSLHTLILLILATPYKSYVPPRHYGPGARNPPSGRGLRSDRSASWGSVGALGAVDGAVGGTVGVVGG